MTPLELKDGDTLIIDNSRFENWTHCPRLGEYASLRRLEPTAGNSALKFGGAIHLALQARYELCKLGAVTPAVERRQLAILEEFWKEWQTPIGDHRTLGLAQQAIMEYNQWYGADPSREILGAGVETPFAVPLGTIVWNGRILKVVWSGRIDLTLRDNISRIVIQDHKTASVGGDYALVDYDLSPQFTGYCYAVPFKLGVPCHHAEVDLLVIRKPAKKKGKGNEFVRKTFEYDDEKIEEWRINTLHVIEGILTQHSKGYFPMHTKSCSTKFGMCDFWSVCTLAPASRENALQTAFKVSTWSPLHETDPIYTRIMALPDSEINPSVHPIETAGTPGPELADLLGITSVG